MFYIIGQLVIMFLALLGLMWCIEWVICRMCSPKAKDFITIVAPSSKEDLEQALRWARQSARWDIWFRPYEVLCVLPKQDAEGYGEIMAAINAKKEKPPVMKEMLRKLSTPVMNENQ